MSQAHSIIEKAKKRQKGIAKVKGDSRPFAGGEGHRIGAIDPTLFYSAHKAYEKELPHGDSVWNHQEWIDDQKKRHPELRVHVECPGAVKGNARRYQHNLGNILSDNPSSSACAGCGDPNPRNYRLVKGEIQCRECRRREARES